MNKQFGENSSVRSPSRHYSASISVSLLKVSLLLPMMESYSCRHVLKSFVSRISLLCRVLCCIKRMESLNGNFSFKTHFEVFRSSFLRNNFELFMNCALRCKHAPQTIAFCYRKTFQSLKFISSRSRS